jgi:hypothetical protein
MRERKGKRKNLAPVTLLLELMRKREFPKYESKEVGVYAINDIALFVSTLIIGLHTLN